MSGDVLVRVSGLTKTYVGTRSSAGSTSSSTAAR